MEARILALRLLLLIQNPCMSSKNIIEQLNMVERAHLNMGNLKVNRLTKEILC